LDDDGAILNWVRENAARHPGCDRTVEPAMISRHPDTAAKSALLHFLKESEAKDAKIFGLTSIDRFDEGRLK